MSSYVPPDLVEERNHPNHWYNRASDLRASTGALWLIMGAREEGAADELGLGRGFRMSVACWPIYIMLSGLALEVIMKAVLVQRGVPESSYGKHGFGNLLQLLNISAGTEEQALLRLYDSMLLWAARYPTPKAATPQKILDHWSLAASVLMSPVSEIRGIELRTANGAADWENFNALWLRYAQMFKH